MLPETQRTFPPMRLGTRTAVQAMRLGATDQENWAQVGGRSSPGPATNKPHLDRMSCDWSVSLSLSSDWSV